MKDILLFVHGLQLKVDWANSFSLGDVLFRIISKTVFPNIYIAKDKDPRASKIS